jgi:membrane protease YdiL (CAAX protease family)
MNAPTDRGASGAWRWAVAFFVVTYVVTAGLWIPIWRSGQPLSALSGRLEFFLLLGTIVPSVVGLALSLVEGGWRGLRQNFGQAARWRFGLGWWALALLLMPLVWLVGLVLGRLAGGPAAVVRLDFLVPVAAIGEEFGWRGYALPRLQGRLGALPAALVIGVVWAAWHLPYYAYPDMHPLPVVLDFTLFALAIIAESVLATWIYNSTGGSVLATMLYHESIHLASLVPVVPGLLGTLLLTVVDLAAAGAAIWLTDGSLTGFRRTGLGASPNLPRTA